MPGMSTDPKYSPAAIDLQDSKLRLAITWDDGVTAAAGYRDLRLACRCAECVDELTGAPKLDPESVSPEIGLAECEQIGLYGLRLVWSTGHRTGIYTWERLRDLAQPVE